MLAQALPRSLTLVGVCYSSGFQTVGVSRVLSVRERCFQNCVLEGRELRARAVGPLIPALIRTVLEKRTAIGKGLLTHQFRTYALTCFWNSCSCIYTPRVVLLDPFCDGEHASIGSFTGTRRCSWNLLITGFSSSSSLE